jgi:restriction endonuclease S subunit
MQLIKETSLRVPPLDIQKRFADELGRIRALEVLQKSQLESLEALFASLQYHAITATLSSSTAEATLKSLQDQTLAPA